MKKAEKDKKLFQSPEGYLQELLSGALYRIDSPGDHLASILEELPLLIGRKYRDGQDRHGGELYRRRVLEEIQDEIIDLIIYFKTLQYQIELALAILQDGVSGMIDPQKACHWAVNILRMGNPEGMEEYKEEEDDE